LLTYSNTEKRKKQQYTETKGIVNNKIQARKGPVFTFSLARGAGRFVSYATDQVHFKREQPQVLLKESQSVRFSKRRTQPACCEYIDTIVGMRLDQPSY